MGRLAVAMRENEHRLRFLGFNTHLEERSCSPSRRCSPASPEPCSNRQRGEQLQDLQCQASANVVVHTFIGGAACSSGPRSEPRSRLLRAGHPDLTRSWLLYQGLIFVLVMLFVPDGIGGLVSACAPTARRCDRASRRPYAVRRDRLLISRASCSRSTVYVLLSDANLANGVLPAAASALPAVQLELDMSPLTWSLSAAPHSRRRAPAVREAPDGIGMEFGRSMRASDEPRRRTCLVLRDLPSRSPRPPSSGA